MAAGPTQPHVITGREKKTRSLWSVTNQTKGFLSRMEMLWREKHPTATLDMKQLNNQRYSIMKKHLLSDLELEKLSRLTELNDAVQEELDDVSDSPAENLNVLVDEPSLSAENLPTDIQTLRKKLMNYLPTDQGQRSYLLKLIYEILDDILAQTNLGFQTMPMANITETNAGAIYF